MNRRHILATVTAAAASGPLALANLAWAQETGEDAATPGVSEDRRITIWRDPGCGCCDAYADYLEGNGYRVTRIDDRNFDRRSVAVGVPEQGLGCHISEIDGYYVSGLVPADIIERLLAERPQIAGITLPGMPANAPGMAAAKTGTLKTYAFGASGISVYSDE